MDLVCCKSNELVSQIQPAVRQKSTTSLEEIQTILPQNLRIPPWRVRCTVPTSPTSRRASQISLRTLKRRDLLKKSPVLVHKRSITSAHIPR